MRTHLRARAYTFPKATCGADVPTKQLRRRRRDVDCRGCLKLIEKLSAERDRRAAG